MLTPLRQHWTQTLIILLLSLPASLTAQERETAPPPVPADSTGLPSPADTLHPPAMPGGLPDYAQPEMSYPPLNHPGLRMPEPQALGREMDFRLPAIQYQPQIQTDPLTGDYRTGGLLWRSGRQFIFTSGSRNSLQGLGGTGHANMTYIFMPTDRLLLSLGSTLTKYDFYNFSAIETGISGSLHYQINDFMTLNAFGAYYLSHSYNNAGYNPYMRTSYYGASLSVDMHEHFGVEVGAQQYFDPRRGKWQTVPIVAPYIILNNKQRIGIDLGGLLQGAFQTDHYDQAQPARSDWQFDKKPAPPKAPIAPNRR